MASYTQNDIISLAKRINNTRRSYLLVNPLQSKHIPVSPAKAFELMNTLGEKVKRKYPQANLVIGFAETATAIGAVVAKSLSDHCYYIQTTRENCGDNISYIEFLEEHSHATEQRLVSLKLEHYLNNTNTIVFVDDEITTGKTLINIIKKLQLIYPQISNKKIVIASIINRVSPSNELIMSKEGIESVCILKIANTDFDSKMKALTVQKPVSVTPSKEYYNAMHVKSVSDPRLGVDISEYYKEIRTVCKEIYEKIKGALNGRVLALGTEETMLPALLLAEIIEKSGKAITTVCHSTTRSPIGINTDADYPIFLGYKIHSFYDSLRDNYIYNISEYDVAIIFTDAKRYNHLAAQELLTILNDNNCREVVFVIGDNDV